MKRTTALATVAALAVIPTVVAGVAPKHGSTAAPGTCDMRTADRRAPDSSRCLGCHDGSVAVAISPRASSTPGEHPVGVDYEAARMRAREGTLRAAGELPPALPLVNGKVACITCHSADSREPSHTTLPMAGSRLCFACHSI